MYPPLYQAVLDRRLPDAALRVFVYLCHELVPYELKPVKLDGVSRALRLGRASVQRSVKLLLHLGYLERGPNDGQLFTMRLSQPRIEDRPVNGPQSPS